MPPSLAVLADKRADGEYVPSYAFPGEDLGERHIASVMAVEAIPGWLRPEDILKLYELAHFSPGPILEIGCYRGKSTVVIARALAGREQAVPFVSVDIDPDALRATSEILGERGLADRVLLMRGTANACLKAVPNLRPSLVFVDGDHSRAGASRDLIALRHRVPVGALLLLHDYHDPRNADPSDRQYGVVEAVERSWVAGDCEFAGVFGCCGLFVRRRGGPAGGTAERVVVPIVRTRRSRGLRELRRRLGLVRGSRAQSG